MSAKLFTFLGKGQAKPGYLFIYEGEAEKCGECSYLKVCHGKLKSGNLYRVVEVKDKEVECPILGESLLVRVEPAEIQVALESKYAIEGATVKFLPQDCGQLECQYFDLCVPASLQASDRAFKVVRVGEAFTCPRSGNRLVQAWLLPQEV
ncbi:MAG: UPF0179 family protein [Candidatus Hecatellaceae archaeon]